MLKIEFKNAVVRDGGYGLEVNGHSLIDLISTEGKDPTTTAKSMFKGVEKTFTLECVNFNGAVTGAGAVVRDSSTGLSGIVWIDSDTHTWNNGVATMSLTVTLKQMMDTKEG